MIEPMQTGPQTTWRPMLLWSAGLVLGLALIVGCSRWAYHVWLFEHRIPAILDRYCFDPLGPLPEDGIANLGGPKRAAALLREYLRVTSPRVSNTAQAFYLLSLCDDKIVPELIIMLGDVQPSKPIWEDRMDPNVCKRMNAAEALWQIGPRAASAVPALTKALQDPEFCVRYRAARALGRMGPAAEIAVPDLIKLLSKKNGIATQGYISRDTTVLCSAMNTLGKLGPAAGDAVPHLVKWLDDEDDRIRLDAVEALGNIGPAATDAVPYLTNKLHDKDGSVRSAAAEALKKIGGEGNTGSLRKGAQIATVPEPPSIPGHTGQDDVPQKEPGRRMLAGKVLVSVPEALQRMFYEKAVRAIMAAYPDADKKTVQEACKRQFLCGQYLIFDGDRGFHVTYFGGPSMSMRFPSGDVLSIDGSLRPAGVTIPSDPKVLSVTEAQMMAEKVRVAVMAGTAKANVTMELVSSGEVKKYWAYWFRWIEKMPKHFTHAGASIDVAVLKSVGIVRFVSIGNALETPEFPVDKMVEQAKQELKSFSEDCLELGETYHLGERRLVWQYRVPLAPGGSPGDVTLWDANTGKLLYSEILSGGQPSNPFRSKEFYVEPTEELMRTRADKLVAGIFRGQGTDSRKPEVKGSDKGSGSEH